LAGSEAPSKTTEREGERKIGISEEIIEEKRRGES
jgi:hypothetical protein